MKCNQKSPFLQKDDSNINMLLRNYSDASLKKKKNKNENYDSTLRNSTNLKSSLSINPASFKKDTHIKKSLSRITLNQSKSKDSLLPRLPNSSFETSLKTPSVKIIRDYSPIRQVHLPGIVYK